MSTAFTRLVWKEHRAQRQLWLVLLGACICTYVLMRLAAVPWLSSLLASSVFCIFFLAAAIAIAFAGEVDDRTVELLRMLPCRTSTLMTAKLTAIMTGCLALFLAIAILSGVFELIGLAFPRIWRTDHYGPLLDAVSTINFIADLLIVCGCTIVASMLVRSVISAIGLAALGCIAAVGVSGFFMWTWYRNSSEELIPLLWGKSMAIAPFVVAAALLARPWHLGKLPLTRMIPLPEASRAQTKVRLLRPLPLWIAALRRIAALPMSQGRVRLILFWREARAALPFATQSLILGVLICVGQFMMRSTDSFILLIFLFLYVHECGQRTMRDDQRSDAMLMLANMGVSARPIWLTKIVSWLVPALIVTITLIAVDSAFAMFPVDRLPWGKGQSIVGLLSRIHTPQITWAVPVTRVSTIDDHWLRLGFALSLALLAFGAGHLTACWIRRQIVAYAASVLLMFAASVWIRVCYSWDLSIWISIVPIGLCFLLATLSTARSWIDRVTTVKLYAAQTVLLIAPPIAFFMLATWHWANMPWYHRIVHSFSTSQRGNASAAIEEYDAEPIELGLETSVSHWRNLDATSSAQIWFRFARQLASSPMRAILEPPRSGWPIENSSTLPLCFVPSEDNVIDEQLLNVFESHLAVNTSWPSLPSSWTAPWANSPAPTVTYLLLADAAALEERGDIDGAIDQHISAFQLSKSLANQTSSWRNWNACVVSQKLALESLRLLLGSVELSDVDLTRVYDKLRNVAVNSGDPASPGRDLVHPGSMLNRRQVFWNLVARNPKVVSDIRGESVDTGAFAGDVSAIRDIERQIGAMGSRERWRALETMSQSRSLIMEGILPPSVINGHDLSHRSYHVDLTHSLRAVQRFAATSTIGDLKDDPTMLAEFLNPYVFPIVVDMVAEERATLVTVLLHRHRLVHGRFPDSLIALDDGSQELGNLHIDPWCGAPFYYLPRGMDWPTRLGRENEQYRIASGQPLLYSCGRSGMPLEHFQQILPSTLELPAATLPPNLILFLGLNERVQRWPLHARVLEIKPMESPTLEEAMTPQKNSDETMGVDLNPATTEPTTLPEK